MSESKTDSWLENIPADLADAYRSVATTVYALCQVLFTLRGKGGELAVMRPDIREPIVKIKSQLDKFIRAADAALQPVRTELTIASPDVRNAHDQALVLAREVVNYLGEWAPPNPVPDQIAVQRSLADIDLRLSRLRNGMHPGLGNFQPTAGLMFETLRATELRRANSPRQTRAVCRLTDRSFWCDGKCVARSLSEDVYAYMDALVKSAPHFRTFKQLQGEFISLKGANQFRLKENIPENLELFIYRSPKGHVLKIPN